MWGGLCTYSGDHVEEIVHECSPPPPTPCPDNCDHPLGEDGFQGNDIATDLCLYPYTSGCPSGYWADGTYCCTNGGSPAPQYAETARREPVDTDLFRA